MKFKLFMIELRHKARAVRLLTVYPIIVMVYIGCVQLLVISTLGAILAGQRTSYKLKDLNRDVLEILKNLTEEIKESWL